MRPHPIHTRRHWRCAQYPVPLTCRWLEWPSIWMTIWLRNLITMLMPILLMTVRCYLHIAMRLQHITTIEKAVNSTAEKFKDHLKMADVRKAEIRDEINKSVSESSEQLDQKIDISSQPLRSEMKKLSDRLNIIQQRVNEAAMNSPSSTFSTSDRRPPVDGCVAQLRKPNIFNNNIGSDPAESPVVHNNTDVFSPRVELPTTPHISSSANHVPNYSNTDRPMLNYFPSDPQGISTLRMAGLRAPPGKTMIL